MSRAADDPARADIDLVHTALRSLRRFAPAEIETCRMARLAGLTNRVYRVDIVGEALCVRIPGEGSALFVDRRAEAANAAAAALAGVAPPLLLAGEDGVMVTRCITDAVPLSPAAFGRADGAAERCGTALRQLHAGADFLGELQPFRVLRDYRETLDRRGNLLPERAQPFLAQADAIESALNVHPARLRPCHCDPTGPNLLDTGERIWIVDWEYSAMCDPMWDLAYLAGENCLAADEVARLLAAYLGRNATPAEAARLTLYRTGASLISMLWALLQIENGNRAADFSAYAEVRLARAASIIEGPKFARALDAAGC